MSSKSCLPLRAAILAVAAAGLVLAGSSEARADCNTPNLLWALPPDGATDVPTNAELHALYVRTAEWLGEDVLLETVDGTAVSATPSFDSIEGRLTLVPDEPLTAGTDYVVHWPKLRGTNTATLGRGKDVAFHTGAGPDTERPQFEGVRSVSWDIDRERDECSKSVDERYAFDLELGAASDDGGRDSLTLLVFMTAGPDVAPNLAEPLLLRAMPPEGQSVRVEETIDRGLGKVCFAAIARDLLLTNVASGQSVACTTTVKPPFFYGCAIGRSHTDRFGLAALLISALLVYARRRR